MLFKLATIVLAIMLVVETVFIVVRVHPANRFKPVEGYSGAVAFDSASGQLCKTFRTKTSKEILDDWAGEEAAKDSAIAGGIGSKAEKDFVRLPDWAANAADELAKQPFTAAQASTAEFVAGLPACKDIR